MSEEPTIKTFKSIEDMTMEELAELDPAQIQKQGSQILNQLADRIGKILFLMDVERVILQTGFEIQNVQTNRTDEYQYNIGIKGGRKSCLVI